MKVVCLCLLLSPLVLWAQKSDSPSVEMTGEVSVLAGEQGAYLVLGGAGLTFTYGDLFIRPGFAPSLRVAWKGLPSFALLGRVQVAHKKVTKGKLRLEIALQSVPGEGWYSAFGFGWKF